MFFFTNQKSAFLKTVFIIIISTVEAASSQYIPKPARHPRAALHQIVAAVVRPFTLDP